MLTRRLDQYLFFRFHQRTEYPDYLRGPNGTDRGGLDYSGPQNSDHQFSKMGVASEWRDCMGKKRVRHSAEFKGKVALEALKGVKTVNELAGHYQLHPTQISQWKRQVQGHVNELFGE